MQAIGAASFLMPGSRMPWTWLFHGAVVRSCLNAVLLVVGEARILCYDWDLISQ